MFRKVKYGSWKQEIVDLLRERLKLRARVKNQEDKIDRSKLKIKELKSEIKLLEVDLDDYFKKAGNEF